MELVEAVILGMIQGIVEWLPVSSEAAISLFMTQILGTAPAESVNTAIYLHVGTMLAALIYFRGDFAEVFRETPDYVKESVSKKSVPEDYPIINFLLVSTLVTGVLGGAIYLFGLEYLPESPALFSALVGVALLVTGAMMLVGKRSSRDYSSVGLGDGVFTGLLQALAIIPGISRSGSTIFGLFYREFDSDDAFKLSFLMSVPAVLAAQIGMNLFSGFEMNQGLLVAGAVSFVVGYLAIDAVLEIAERVEVAYLCFMFAALSFLAALL